MPVSVSPLFTEEGPSPLMERAYRKFEGLFNFLEECYQNRACYEMDEDENSLSDAQMFFLFEEFAKIVLPVLKNKKES